MGGIAGNMLVFSLLLLISLTNANDSPTINTRLYTVCEDIPIGTVAFTIDATDKENDPLTYRLTGSNALYFTVNSATGAVSVARELDAESTALMQLGVEVSDGSSVAPAELNLIIDEANDNRPIFTQSAYDESIPENTRVGATLFTVHATDADLGNAGVVQYKIDEVTPSDGFSLFSIVSGTGEVKLNGPLNYTGLSTFYRLKINASDLGGNCFKEEINYMSSVTFSFITVVDVPDLDPQFIGVPYTGRVEENAPVGHTVLKVAAVDQDTGVNDEIIYSIEESTADGLFAISANEGTITVLSAIDREDVGDTVTLTVKATESKENIHGVRASTTTTIQISILDINDNPPEFYKCEDDCVKETHFTGEVVEHSLGFVPIDMMVKDLDRIYRTELTLDGADKDIFSVEPQLAMSESTVQLLVKQSIKLDYEEIQQIVLKVIAKDLDDTSFQSTATVTINIEDANDNSPKFPKDTYKLEVPEHSPVGTALETITATDPDTMDQGNITYRLLPDSILVYFDVKPKTGEVYVKNQTLLDREVRSLYSATLEAKDTDGKPGSTVLEITVTDINDKPPVISRESYLEFVAEGGQLELKIEATDADDPDTENSQIVFEIEPSMYSENFTIDPNTGVLRSKGELDREALDPKLNGRVELNVTATDKGTPPLSTTVPVVINIEDVNDNTPHFKESSYKFSVKEGEKGAFVGSVYAEDWDQTTSFNRISFSIINGSFGRFIIRSFADERGYRGNITVDLGIELDYESTDKQFNLWVEATDLEQKKAAVMVVVNVLDVNDERPEFKPLDPFSVKENTTITETVGEFIGQDKDGNHSLVYELESMKCRCNTTLTACDSFILDPTGEVRVNPESTMDYEQCDQVQIEAQVIDKFTEKGENNSVTTGLMVINIEDINDNAPQFIPSDSVFVVVSESASKGTSVAGVTATDNDSGINSQIEFKVTAVQFKDINNQTSDMRLMFEAITTQQKDIYVGIIQTTEGLDMKLKGEYLVTVTATDTGDLSTSTVLVIYTVDESYKVELEFTSSVAQVEKDLNEIKRALTAATKTAVQIVSIRSGSSSESRASPSTIIEAYFVYVNGTALNSDKVETMLSDPDHFLVLTELGLQTIGSAPVVESEVSYVTYILLGVVGGLFIVLVVLITSLLCTRRNYGRKLKAAKAMNSASMMTSDNQKGGAVVPGTNKYTMEGANPVLNLHIDTAIALDMDEQSSDVDKVSLNSLDYSDDMNSERHTNPMMMIEEEEEEEEDQGPPEYSEALGAALAQRGQKKSAVNSQMGFSNPAFNTTDL